MRAAVAVAPLMMGLFLPVGARSQNAFKTDYDSHRVFALRADVVGAAAPPLFYKGAVDAAANQVSVAAQELGSVIAAAPDSEQAYQAHDVLGNLFFRNGMYRAGFREIRAALQERPHASDANQMLPIFTVLNSLPEMKTVSIQPSTVRIEPKSIFLPLELNGQRAEFFFDTGAGLSLIGESEAKALGLSAEAVDGTMGDASGRGVSGLRIALAKDLVLGGLHLQNVPFIVVSDSGEPWKTLPVARRGILGLPILLAMKTLRWKPTGWFEFGFPGTALDLATCNVLFHNSNPVIDVEAGGKHLDFTLDTGAVTTDLNPAFAEALPGLMKTGTPETQTIEGLGGTTEGRSILLPSLTLHLGGGTAVLKPAHVFTEHGNGGWAAGNLGMDVLSQATAFTLDFRAMTLRLQ